MCLHLAFSKIISIASNSSRSSAYYQNNITPYYLEEEDEEEEDRPEEGNETNRSHTKHEHETHSEEEEEAKITQAESLVNQQGRAEEPEKNRKLESKARDHRLPAIKKPEPFLICVNELDRSNPSWAKNNLVEMKEKRKTKKKGRDSSQGSSSARSRTSGGGMSFKFSSGSSSQTEEDDRSKTSVDEDDKSSMMSKGRSSIRSQASTIASSFVEIVLSSCCSTYSSAFNGSDPSVTKSSRGSRSSSINPPTWKRFSSPLSGSSLPHQTQNPNRRSKLIPTNPSQLVSNLFSKKIQLLPVV